MTEYSVDQAAVQESADFLIQYLRDAGFTGSIENGTALYDQVILPIGMLFSMFQAELKKTRAYLSLNAAVEDSADLGEDADTAIDAVLSNWFVERNVGTPAYGTLNLVFSTPQNFMVFEPGVTYFYIDGVPFTVSARVVAAYADFIPTANTINNTTEYTLQLPVIAQIYQSMVVGASDTVVSAIDNVYLLRVSVAGTFTSGTDKESNEDFIARTEKVINTRELISDRAITTVLLDQLADIKQLFVARYGHEALIRDIKTFENIVCHIGNKADIYCSVNLEEQYVDIPYEDDTVTEFTVSDYTDLPVVDIIRAEDADGFTKYVKMYFTSATNSVELAWATDILSIEGLEYAMAQDYSLVLDDDNEDTYDDEACRSVVVSLNYTLITSPVASGSAVTFVAAAPAGFLGAEAVTIDEIGDDIYSVTLTGVDEGLFGAAGQVTTCSIPSYAKDSQGTRRIHFLTSQVLKDAYDLVYSEDQRVTNHDPAIKAPYPVQLSLDITVKTDAAVDEADVKGSVISYVRDIRLGATFSISNLVKAVHTNTIGVVYVGMPMTADYKIRDPKTGAYLMGTITDRFELPVGNYSDQLHPDTIGFYIGDDDINVTVTAVPEV